MVKKFKKMISMLTLSCILICGNVPAAVAATDTRNHWAEPTISRWVEEGLINGYEDGSFRPDHAITRAETAALINRKFHIAVATEEVHFSDLEMQSWQYEPLSAAIQADYMNGYEDGTIRPDGEITRQELANIIKNLLRLQPNEKMISFTDKAQIPAWSKNSIAAVAAKEIMVGYPDGSFAPARTLTRAEAVVTLDRASRFQENTTPIVYSYAGVYGPEQGNEMVSRDVTVNKQGVVLRNMTISGNLLLDEGIGEGDVTLQNVTVRGQTTVKGGGANSIHLKNSTIASLTIEKKNGKVRISATGMASVQTVEVLSPVIIEEDQIDGPGFENVVLRSDLPEGTEIQLTGDFQRVQVASKGTKVLLVGGSIAKLDIDKEAVDNRFTLGTNAVVKELVTNAVLYVSGQGTIEQATLNEGAEATTFEKQPVAVTGQPPSEPEIAGGSGQSQPKPQPKELTIQAAVVGCYKIEVKFSRAVKSSEVDKVVVKTLDGYEEEIVEYVFSANHKKMTVVLKEGLSEGEYIIELYQYLSNGNEDKIAEQSLFVEVERIVKFEYLLDSAAWNPLAPTEIKVKFALINQYGENAASRYGYKVIFSFQPGYPIEAPVPDNEYVTLHYDRALVENEKLFIYAFYEDTFRIKKELIVSRHEIPSTSPGVPFEETYKNKHIELGFQVTDSVQHSSQPILYLTDKENSKLYAVNYENGVKTSVSLPLPPESITYADGKVYISLLKGNHSLYWFTKDQMGAIAVVDASTLTLQQVFDISLDPYDIAVDRSGYIYVASGSGQWTEIRSYSPTDFQEVDAAKIYQGNYIHMHPKLNRIYAIDTCSNPIDIKVYNVSDGSFTPDGYDSPYHGEYAMDTNMKISPDGTYIFNGAGTVFRANEEKSNDVRYFDSLNTNFSDIAFDLNAGRFYTAKDDIIRAYYYDTFKKFGEYHTDGSTKALYNSSEHIVTVSTIGTRYVIELIDKDE